MIGRILGSSIMEMNAARGEDTGEPKLVSEVIKEYDNVFGEPTQLPPSRGVFDHHISLVEGTSPSNARPYRYSPVQKDVIEKLVQEILAQGIIQQSSSPYASPVVLVGKRMGQGVCAIFREYAPFFDNISPATGDISSIK